MSLNAILSTSKGQGNGHADSGICKGKQHRAGFGREAVIPVFQSDVPEVGIAATGAARSIRKKRLWAVVEHQFTKLPLPIAEGPKCQPTA